jgi:hypothetical protein
MTNQTKLTASKQAQYDRLCLAFYKKEPGALEAVRKFQAKWKIKP